MAVRVLAIVLMTCVIARVQAPAATNKLGTSRLAAMGEAVSSGKFKKPGSVPAARNGKILYEHYFDGGAATLRSTRPVTKTITGTLAGVVGDRKMLRLDRRGFGRPERRHTQNSDARKERITVEDLLTMNSSMECDDWSNSLRGNEERIYLIEHWLQFPFDPPLRGIPAWEKPPQQCPYGRACSDCTTGRFALGQATHLRAVGMRMDGLLGPPLRHDAFPLPGSLFR